jgi:hypothetical protein
MQKFVFILFSVKYLVSDNMTIVVWDLIDVFMIHFAVQKSLTIGCIGYFVSFVPIDTVYFSQFPNIIDGQRW